MNETVHIKIKDKKKLKYNGCQRCMRRCFRLHKEKDDKMKRTERVDKFVFEQQLKQKVLTKIGLPEVNNVRNTPDLGHYDE